MIYPGYLALETHPDKPGVVKMFKSVENPQDHPSPTEGGKVRYILLFEDLDRGFMLAQSKMSRTIVDLNNNLYKKSIAVAMGDLETVQINHKEVWRDSDLTEQELIELEESLARNRQKIARRGLYIALLKWAAIGFIVLNLFSPLISAIINGGGIEFVDEEAEKVEQSIEVDTQLK